MKGVSQISLYIHKDEKRVPPKDTRQALCSGANEEHIGCSPC